MRWTLVLALLPTFTLVPSSAQSTSPRPEDLGTVSGHITCSDTQRPARDAAVSLISTTITTDDPENLNPWNPASVGPVHTDLNGGYTIPSVPPGQYFLRVDYAGYATPLTQFTAAELKTPTPEIEQRIQRDLRIISVAPNSTLQADVTIRRAGSISGRITYDDGSPVINTGLGYARRDAHGKLQDFAHNGYLTGSDGEYTIESLPAGEYVVRITLIANEQHVAQVNYGDGATRANKLVETPAVVLPIYSGSAFRAKDAAVIKVEDGQETHDVDIIIPVSRLHDVSGALLAKDGHAINDATVKLLYPDTREELESVRAGEDGTFHLRYVPEGNYILAVTGARDISLIQIPVSNDPAGGTRPQRKILRTYSTLEQPLTVQTDIQSLNLTLPDQPTRTASN